MERKIEALLFMSPDPLTERQIAKLLGVSNLEVKTALGRLIEEYKNKDTSIEIVEEHGYYMRVKDEFLDVVSKVTPHTELTKGELKTLAFIAKKEGKTGVLQSDVIKALGSVYDHIHRLEELGFIKAKPKGRSKLLYTTPKFRTYFKVENL